MRGRCYKCLKGSQWLKLMETLVSSLLAQNSPYSILVQFLKNNEKNNLVYEAQ